MLRLMKSLVDSNPSAVAVIDGSGRIVLANRSCEHLFGYTSEQLGNRPFWELFPRRVTARLPDFAIGGGAPLPVAGQAVELTAVRKDGGEFPAEVGFNAAEIAGRRFFFCTLTDLTGRKATEAALRNTEAQYRSLVESLPLNVFVKDL